MKVEALGSHAAACPSCWTSGRQGQDCRIVRPRWPLQQFALRRCRGRRATQDRGSPAIPCRQVLGWETAKPALGKQGWDEAQFR